VPVARETKLVTEALGVDVLRLISSGALVATVPPEKLNESFDVLHEVKIEAAVIGIVKEQTGHLVEVISGSSIRYVDDVYVSDEIFRLWGR
jgi:hydrogenase expression/formation protein HypE